MATAKYRIESGQVFDRLVRERARELPISKSSSEELDALQQRVKTLLKTASDHHKKHFDTFLKRETYRQVLESGKHNGEKIPSLSKEQYEKAETNARQALTLRYRMRLLQIEQAAQRMQLRVVSSQKSINPFSKAERLRERGASLKVAMRRHYNKHYQKFVKEELRKTTKGEFQTEQSKLLEREKAEHAVLSRLNKKMARVDRVTEKLYQQQLKKAEKTQKQHMRMKR